MGNFEKNILNKMLTTIFKCDIIVTDEERELVSFFVPQNKTIKEREMGKDSNLRNDALLIFSTVLLIFSVAILVAKYWGVGR